MAKLELALLVGADSKEWLVRLEEAVKRFEKVATILSLPKGGKEALAKVKEEEDEELDKADEADEDDDFSEKKPTKKKSAKSFEDEDEAEEDKEGVPEDDEESEDDEEDFKAPSKKAAKAKKLTVDDVNDACKARAKAKGGPDGRKEVIGILKKKFKVQSVTDLKPEQYAAVIAALK